ALIGIPSPAHNLARAGIPLLLLAELVAVGAFAETDPPSAHNDVHAEALTYLKADPGWFRVDVDVATESLWSPSALTAEGFAVPQGTGNPMELYRYNQFYWTIPYKDSPVYQLLGVKYIIVPKGAYPGGEGIWPAFQADEWIDIHLNTQALPRVWLSYHTQPVEDLDAAREIIFTPEFEPFKVATIENGPKIDNEGNGTIEVRYYTPNQLALYVKTSDQTLLVLSDIHYPGWEGSINGQPAPIYPADGIFRGMLVPAGTHEIVMQFFPISLQLGLGMMSMAILIISAGIWLKQK
ncbi:MAG: hypothetical protein U9Q70_07795, partial [Chloroflexota bacterium]|nr:hypothetical protein [Chloroflexota bacterium]